MLRPTTQSYTSSPDVQIGDMLGTDHSKSPIIMILKAVVFFVKILIVIKNYIFYK